MEELNLNIKYMNTLFIDNVKLYLIKTKNIKAILVLFIVCFFFLTSCKKDKNPVSLEKLDNIDISSSSNGVVQVPHDLPEPLSTVFSNYTKVVAPNGKPIHIFATSGVEVKQIVRARNILEYILRSAQGTQYGSDKSAIANKMSDNKATLIYFDNEQQAMDYRDQVSDLGLGIQDLYANESPVEGSASYINNSVRDASYEEIFHMVHNYGIVEALPAYDNEIKQGEQAASAVGIYNYGGDVEVSRFEYIISAFDVYFGFWAHSTSGSSFYGEYTPTTRANLQSIDPTGYGLVEKFHLPYLNWNIQLDNSFTGTFSLSLDAFQSYTLKSQYIKDVTLTGSNNTNLKVNNLDNNLTGNSGTNTVIFSGVYSEYTVNTNNGVTTVTDNISNRDGVNTLNGIEKIQFMDQTVNL